MTPAPRPGLPGPTPAVLAAGLLAVLGWELSGLDLVVAGLFGTPDGFPWRNSFWTARVLYDGARAVSIAALFALVAYTFLPVRAGTPSRRTRVAWLAVIVLTIVAVPALKRFSATSCPWELALFGGTAAYVPHWQFLVADGGPGGCFPSGGGRGSRWRP